MALIKGKDLKDKKLFKFFRINMTNYNFTYKEGENIDVNSDVLDEKCGLTFMDESYKKFISFYLKEYYFYIGDVSIDDEEDILKIEDGIYKAHKIILSNIRYKIDFDLTENEISKIINFTEGNVGFSEVYRLLHKKNHVKELIQLVMNIPRVVDYLYIFVKSPDEDEFFTLADFYFKGHPNGKNEINTDFLVWLEFTFKKLLAATNNTENFFIKYLNVIYNHYKCKFNYKTLQMFWNNKKVINNVLEKIIDGTCVCPFIDEKMAFILINNQEVIDFEKLLMFEPKLYQFIHYKTLTQTNLVLTKKDYNIINYIPEEIMKQYNIRLELFKKNYIKDEEYSDLSEFIMDIIKHEDYKDEFIFNKIFNIPKAKEILFNHLEKKY